MSLGEEDDRSGLTSFDDARQWCDQEAVDPSARELGNAVPAVDVERQPSTWNKPTLARLGTIKTDPQHSVTTNCMS
jgi:hypothetical protein